MPKESRLPYSDVFVAPESPTAGTGLSHIGMPTMKSRDGRRSCA
jgi:hypothetical protein